MILGIYLLYMLPFWVVILRAANFLTHRWLFVVSFSSDSCALVLCRTTIIISVQIHYEELSSTAQIIICIQTDVPN